MKKLLFMVSAVVVMFLGCNTSVMDKNDSNKSDKNVSVEVNSSK